MATFLWFLITAAALFAPGAHCELIQNGGFENGVAPWVCQMPCNLSISNDAYGGSSSIRVYDRVSKQGLAQDVNTKADTRYKLTGFVKFLSFAAGEIFETVVMVLRCKDSNNGDARVTIQFGKVPHIRIGMWVKVGDANYIPPGYVDCRIYVQANQNESIYLFDNVSLVEVPELTNWRQEALANIESERKSNMKIKLRDSVPGTYTVEVNQTSHLFGFSSHVGEDQMSDPSYKKYQDFFYEHFEWATINNVKWKALELKRGVLRWDRADAVINVLNDHGIKIRCHNMFWGFPKNTPDWVVELDVPELKVEMEKRLNEVTNFTKGRVEHWAVSNENLHGYWYEERLNDTDATGKMFKDMHAIDSEVELFLNDYGVLGVNMAMGLRDQALYLLSTGTPVHAIGIQGHLITARVDITLIKHRLDIVAEAGLPIWISALTVNEPNATIKARVLDDLMTLYFGYPPLKGINFCGFWDGIIGEPTAALFEGPDLEPNEGGTVFLNLMNSWKTNENVVLNVVDGEAVETIRGFKGDYSVVLKRDGEVLEQRSVTMHDDIVVRFKVLE